jgi:RNA polymerase sigma-70 factor (ECF subfamily)
MTITADDGDLELIAAAQQGERSALDAFVRRHQGWVRNVVYATIGNPSIVDDIVQHVWTSVWEKIGTLVDPTRWRGWLYRMAKNAAIDAGLKQARERERRVDFSSIGCSESSGSDPAKALIDAERHQQVLSAIRQLSEIYREPFILRHLNGWSYAEIGEAMSLPVDTVETRLVRARRLLRAALTNEVEARNR